MQPEISRLLARIHEAGFAADAWPEALTSLSNAVGAAGAACIISNRTTGRADWVCFSGLSAEFEADYVNHYASLDPLTPLLDLDRGWTKLSDCLSDSVLRKSEWYNDFVLSCGIRDILAARLVETPSHFANFGIHQQLGRAFGNMVGPTIDNLTAELSSATLRHIEHLFVPEPDEINSELGVNGARYYFHVCNGKQYPDETGAVFPGQREALAHASVLADELSLDGTWDGFAISVMDSDRRLIAQVPVHK